MNSDPSTERLAGAVAEFINDAPELVCVAGRQFYRFCHTDLTVRRLGDSLALETPAFCLRVTGSFWKRTTHRFHMRGREGVLLLRPSRRNELWLRRQQFRWACEDQAARRWKIMRSSLRSGPGRSGAILRLVLQRGGHWFLALAAGEEEKLREESLLAHLLSFWRRFESSGTRRVAKGLLFLPPPQAEAVSRLILDLRPPVEVYCLPALNLFVRSGASSVPLLWPSQTLRQEAQALCDQLAFRSPARAVVRNGGDCCFEYLGIPFAVFSADASQWRFPLKEDAVLPDGEEARCVARGEYRRLRESRRPHGRCRCDPLYQHYSERWLESLIVQDPKRLDPVLRAAPVYTQVPAYLTRRRVIDLVAVTESGRLVVIEVKAQSALELLLQGLAYWRIVWQAQQENGFQRNGYFPGVALSEEPPLLYCVTPLLLLHPEARGLAACLQPKVEAVLVGINSDWRAGLKVLQRERINILSH